MNLTVKALLLTGLCLVMQNYLPAQEKLNLKFGKVEPADFDLSSYKFDTSAGAVYIADVATSDFENGNVGTFGLVFRRQMRIKILNKNGFDAASMEVPIYFSGSAEERLEKLRAVTYNLEDGKVIEAKLDEASIFKDKINRDFFIKKFTLPAVKEGSIIEIAYTVRSDFYRSLRPWYFQREYPTLWSEYTVSIPSCFNYVFLTQGYHPFHIKTQKKVERTYMWPGRGGMGITTYENRWVMKNVPELKVESYVTSLRNHLSSIQFQLSDLREPFTPKRIMNNWFELSEELLKDPDFGESINKANNWLDDDMKMITAGAKTPLDKAKAVYSYVRSNFTCTDHSDIWLSNPLKSVFKTKNGNVSDINLLLIAMLKHEGIEAEPILLSTRDHGLTHEVYPMLSRFNYVIAGVTIGESLYFLDASEPKLGFGWLPSYCYNGHARFINQKSPDPIYFIPDSLKQVDMTTAFVFNGENGKLGCNFTHKLDYFESLKLRNELAKTGKDKYREQIQQSLPSDFKLGKLEFDSLDNFDQPLQLRYSLDINTNGADILYFNPMLGAVHKDNPFKSAERRYPVEMPYTFDEIYVFQMDVPEGYVVDEIPKSARVGFNEGEGYFEYIIDNSGSKIMLRSRIKFTRANFDAADYEGLRNFFDQIVKKQNEQIVFKKK